MKFIIACFCAALLACTPKVGSQLNSEQGAWLLQHDGHSYKLLMADGYAMVAKYNISSRQFFETFGGPYRIENERLLMDVQFHTANKSLVGKQSTFEFDVDKNELETDLSGSVKEWKRIGGNENALSGNWRITQIMRDGKMAEMPLRARRTLKLLAGNQFQWAAINIETGEFSGTGGGTYTYVPGSYVETIEYFSRDSTRVGASLPFNDTLRAGEWIHSGKSSRGEPIREVWSRFK